MDVIVDLIEILFGAGGFATAAYTLHKNKRNNMQCRCQDVFARFAKTTESHLSFHTNSESLREVCGEMKSYFPSIISELDHLCDLYEHRNHDEARTLLNSILAMRTALFEQALNDFSPKLRGKRSTKRR